jgi:hypothetical protein
VIRELQSLAKTAGRIYLPPPPAKPVKYFRSHKARPIDRWQDRAECSGRVEVTDEPPKNDQCRRVAHEVERPPVPAGLPQLLELFKLTRKTVDELVKMNYRYPPAITPFVRGQTARLRIHRLRHWRWGSKAHWADRVRSDRWHGFLCEGGVASTSLPLDA